MKKKCKKKVYMGIVALFAMLLLPLVASAQTALQGFSGSGTTNSTGSFKNVQGQWVIVPHSLTDYPVITHVQARLVSVDWSNALAVVNFYTSTANELRPSATTAASGTTITVAQSATNGIVSGDVLVLWDAQTGAYYRLVASTPSANTITVAETIPVQTDTSDRIFRMTKAGVLNNVPYGQVSGAPTYPGVITASGNVFVGRSGKPVLVEASGTNSPVLNIVTAIAGGK